MAANLKRVSSRNRRGVCPAWSADKSDSRTTRKAEQPVGRAVSVELGQFGHFSLGHKVASIRASGLVAHRLSI